jgi:phytoene dehydrogenase-like protein
MGKSRYIIPRNQYPEGGMGAFTQRIAEKIEAFGGTVRTGAEVVRVLSGQQEQKRILAAEGG